MAKLSDAQVKALREIADGKALAGGTLTVRALRNRHLIKPSKLIGGQQGYAVTQSGAYELSRIEHAEREAAYQAERLSRPVPASAFVEPAARNPIVMAEDMGNGCDCDQDGCKVCFPEPEATPEPTVPQSWVDQLLALLDSGVRVAWDGQGWYTVFPTFPAWLTMSPERLSATVAHAIASGVVRPTTGLREPVRLVRVPERAVAATGCDQCSVEPGGKHRYAGCPAN